jgi:hypothetical protein
MAGVNLVGLHVGQGVEGRQQDKVKGAFRVYDIRAYFQRTQLGHSPGQFHEFFLGLGQCFWPPVFQLKQYNVR